MKLLATVLAGILLTSTAFADTGGGRWATAGTWYEGCKVKSNELKCAAYIRGLHDGIRVQAATFKVKPSYCAPSSVTAGEMLSSFLAFIPNNKDMLEGPTATVFITHMYRRYPCNH